MDHDFRLKLLYVVMNHVITFNLCVNTHTKTTITTTTTRAIQHKQQYIHSENSKKQTTKPNNRQHYLAWPWGKNLKRQFM